MTFPFPLMRLSFNVSLDGKQVPFQILDEGAREIDAGRTVRIRVDPEVYRKPVVLEASYQFETGQSGAGSYQTTLQPPILVGAVMLGPARWAIELPPRRLPLLLSDDATWEQQWGWLGWLVRARPR